MQISKNPNVRSIYPSLADAPPPTEDGCYISVEDGEFWLIDYMSKGGEWVLEYRYYPARMC